MSDVPKRIAWQVGQIAIKDKQVLVKIDRVFPSGRFIVAGVTYDVEGWARGAISRWQPRSRIEPLTPETEAKLAISTRATSATRNVRVEIARVISWLNNKVSGFNKTVMTPDEVEITEQLVVAIQQIMRATE